MGFGNKRFDSSREHIGILDIKQKLLDGDLTSLAVEHTIHCSLEKVHYVGSYQVTPL